MAVCAFCTPRTRLFASSLPCCLHKCHFRHSSLFLPVCVCFSFLFVCTLCSQNTNCKAVSTLFGHLCVPKMWLFLICLIRHLWIFLSALSMEMETITCFDHKVPSESFPFNNWLLMGSFIHSDTLHRVVLFGRTNPEHHQDQNFDPLGAHILVNCDNGRMSGSSMVVYNKPLDFEFLSCCQKFHLSHKTPRDLEASSTHEMA